MIHGGEVSVGFLCVSDATGSWDLICSLRQTSELGGRKGWLIQWRVLSFFDNHIVASVMGVRRQHATPPSVSVTTA